MICRNILTGTNFQKENPPKRTTNALLLVQTMHSINIFIPLLICMFQRGESLLYKIKESMMELIALRGQLVKNMLSTEDLWDLKRDIVSVIDWGNG